MEREEKFENFWGPSTPQERREKFLRNMEPMILPRMERTNGINVLHWNVGAGTYSVIGVNNSFVAPEPVDVGRKQEPKKHWNVEMKEKRKAQRRQMRQQMKKRK